MAVVTERWVEFRNGDVYAFVTFENTTGVISAAGSHNETGAPVGRITVSLGTTVVIDQAIPVGDLSRTIGGKRNVTELSVMARAQ